MTKAFDCKMCGHCCEGEGGIIISLKDQQRVAKHLDLSVNKMLVEYALDLNGKPCVRTGKDGFCVFYKQETGCDIHLARPDICRAWPFFRGNLIDEESWHMIQDYCPGINPKAGHGEFVRQGHAYLHKHGLGHNDPAQGANALIVDNEK